MSSSSSSSSAMATTDAAITSSNSTPIPAISGAITTLNNPSSSDSLDPQDISTRAILWKQGRGRSFAFLKPWRERLVIVDHKKMILSYYQIPEGFDWRNQLPSADSIKGSIPLEQAIIEDLPDAGRPHSFAVLNGEVHVNLSCPTATQKTQWMALLQNISQSGREEANKEKFQRLHQMGTGTASPGKLLKQNSRITRSLTPRQLTPLSGEPQKDLDDEDDSCSTEAKPRPISYDRSRSPSPTPPTPPPRPLSKKTPSPLPPEITDPDAIFQQAVLSAALNKEPSESAQSSNSLGVQIEIIQESTDGQTKHQDVQISSPNLKQLSEEQKVQELKKRESALKEQEEEEKRLEEERLRKEKEVEEKTNEIQSKLSEYRRTTFRDIAHSETEKAEFEKLKATMTEREAAHLVAEQGEHSIYVKELKRIDVDSTGNNDLTVSENPESINDTVDVSLLLISSPSPPLC